MAESFSVKAILICDRIEDLRLLSNLQWVP